MRTKDSRYRFLLEKANVRGVLVHLDDTWQEVLARSAYPENVRRVLGDAMVAMPLLASTIKFEGKLTLQARGTGPVNLLVVQANADGGQRGLARWKGEPPVAPLSSVFGDATLTIQIETGKRGDIYQGVVDAAGENLQQALAGYFENSEQLPTRLWLMSDESQAAGLLLQQLPVEDGAVQSDETAASRLDDWQRAVYLAGTITSNELLNNGAGELLRKLFHTDDVRLFDAEPLRFSCGCSRERTAGLIAGLGRAEVEDILAEQGSVEIICEFCNSANVFDAVDVEAIFRGDDYGTESTTIH